MNTGASKGWRLGLGVMLLSLLARHVSGGSPTLVAIDTGAELFESHYAPGRRVSFLLGDVDVSLWNANMHQLMQNALSWVSTR
jgi:hypothetical protein